MLLVVMMFVMKSKITFFHCDRFESVLVGFSGYPPYGCGAQTVGWWQLLIGGGDVGDEDGVDVDDDYVEYEDSSLKRHGDCWWWW